MEQLISQASAILRKRRLDAAARLDRAQSAYARCFSSATLPNASRLVELMDELGIGIDDLRQDAEAMAAMRRNERELTDLRNAGLVAVEAVRAAEAKLHEAQNTMRPPVIEQAHAAVIAAEERRLELDKRAAALRTEHLLLRHKAARALDGREWAGDDAALGSVPLASPSSIANSRREEF